MGVEYLHAVPNLTTALTGPLHKIEGHLLERQTEIEQWFRAQFLQTPAPFYASVDLRNAGFKLAPVDTNLFPAGFNNLNPAFQPLCVQAIQVAAERICAKACRVLIVPENHTRNQFYLEHLAALENILRLAGFGVRIGSLAPEITQETTLTLASGRTLKIAPITREGERVKVGDFTPCFVLLNNDLSAGRPAILENISQPVVPPMALGWSNRLKSSHFAHYRALAVDFAAQIDIDPWLIDPVFRQCGKIDFHQREGETCLAKRVDEVIAEIRAKYREYGIDQKPFVIVKADAGTYGMGIMTAYGGDDVRNLNRKQRNKMAVIKEGHAVQNVLVQEGVYTFETWGEQGGSAEPVVYMIDHFVVGGFYRVHTGRGADQNLNAPGMHFESLAFADCCTNPDPNKAPDAQPNRFYAYGVVARLALLAAAREVAATGDRASAAAT